MLHSGRPRQAVGTIRGWPKIWTRRLTTLRQNSNYKTTSDGLLVPTAPGYGSQIILCEVDQNMRVEFHPSSRRDKKMMACFYDDERKIKTVHFGASGAKDYTVYWRQNPDLAKQRRLAYIKRHRVTENWRDPMRPATLARYILWERPTVESAIKKFKTVFKLN